MQLTTAETGEAEMEGYGGPRVCKLAGITYRQLDYWARTGLLTPSLQEAQGSGTQRLYSFEDVVRLRIIKRILDTGMNLNKIRRTVEWLRREMEDGKDLSGMTLMSDGASIFAVGSPQEVIDVLQRGQAVFAIAIGPVMEELAGGLLELPPMTETGRGEPGAAAAAG